MLYVIQYVHFDSWGSDPRHEEHKFEAESDDHAMVTLDEWQKKLTERDKQSDRSYSPPKLFQMVQERELRRI